MSECWVNWAAHSAGAVLAASDLKGKICTRRLTVNPHPYNVVSPRLGRNPGSNPGECTVVLVV